MKPHAILLAGGAATRIGGGDKPLRRLGDARIIDHVIARIVPQVQAMAISANGDPARFAEWHLPVLADATAGQGPLAGILAGLLWARDAGSAWLLSVPGDTPFLPPNLAARLAAVHAPIAHAASARQDHPAIALIATSLADDLQARLASGTRSIRDWMRPHAPRRVVFETSAGDPFLNVNTPADLIEAERRLGV